MTMFLPRSPPLGSAIATSRPVSSLAMPLDPLSSNEFLLKCDISKICVRDKNFVGFLRKIFEIAT